MKYSDFNGLYFSYWIGSQNTGGNPIYQYRLILPLQDDKVVNVATDMDFNIECEVKVPITPNVLAKSNFTVSSLLIRYIN